MSARAALALSGPSSHNWAFSAHSFEACEAFPEESAAAFAARYLAGEAAEAEEWVVDTGAALHVVKDPSRLINLRAAPADAHITTADGTEVKVQAVGDVELGRVNGLKGTVTLRNVLAVLGAAVNLL